jgi:hypothetical protein
MDDGAVGVFMMRQPVRVMGATGEYLVPAESYGVVASMNTWLLLRVMEW